MMGGGMMGIDGWLFTGSAWVLPVLLAVTMHEAGHGFAAWRLGDDTAYRMGRVSLNPLRHVDPFGTILLPAMLLLARSPFMFGWAKPVPVAFHRLNNPRWGTVVVALAGPAVNILLALLSALLLRLVMVRSGYLVNWIGINLVNSITINLVLAAFNMLPIPPLDGGRVAVGLLPRPLSRWLAGTEQYGMLVLIGLMFLLPMLGDQLGIDLNVLLWALGPMVNFLTQTITSITGIA